MTEPATILGLKAGLLVSAGTGGIVAVVRTRGPWWMRLMSGFSGAAVSYYWAPLVAPVAEIAMERGVEWALGARIDLDSAGVLSAVGLMIGSTGLVLPQMLVDVLRGERTLPLLKQRPKLEA